MNAAGDSVVAERCDFSQLLLLFAGVFGNRWGILPQAIFVPLDLS